MLKYFEGIGVRKFSSGVGSNLLIYFCSGKIRLYNYYSINSVTTSNTYNILFYYYIFFIDTLYENNSLFVVFLFKGKKIQIMYRNK